jgi:predicted Zn-dependent peptidase
VDADRLAALWSEKLDLPAAGASPERSAPQAALSELTLYPEDLAQLYLSLAVPAPSDRDPKRRAVHLLVEIFGGGMSSRLFQAIREKAGLAYSVYAYSEHFEDTGLFGTSLAVSPKRGREALERTLDEMRLLVRDGLRPGELDAAQAQVRGSLLMGMESLTNRMTRLARAELRWGRRETEEETLAAYAAVTETDVLEAAEQLLNPARQSLVALGPARIADLEVVPFQRVAEATP